MRAHQLAGSSYERIPALDQATNGDGARDFYGVFQQTHLASSIAALSMVETGVPGMKIQMTILSIRERVLVTHWSAADTLRSSGIHQGQGRVEHNKFETYGNYSDAARKSLPQWAR